MNLYRNKRMLAFFMELFVYNIFLCRLDEIRVEGSCVASLGSTRSRRDNFSVKFLTYLKKRNVLSLEAFCTNVLRLRLIC